MNRLVALLGDGGAVLAGAVLLAVAAAVPPVWWLLADLPLTAVQQQWEMSEILFDATDFVFAALALSLLARGLPRGRHGRRAVPFFWAWMALGGLFSVAYVVAPINAPVLDSPVRVAYQLYRYCWRPLAFYLFAALCIRDRRLLGAWLVTVLVSAAIFSVPAIAQGYAGEFASGPFSHKNELGAALVGPLVLACAGALAGRPRSLRWGCLAAALLIGRALMFSLSRGAMVAAIAGIAVVAVGLASDRRLRRVLLALLPLALVGALVLLAKSDRPVVAELFTATAGTEDANMQFRMQQRWPHFTAIILEHPWLGVGDGRDLSLGEEMNTPHNGYLSLALIHGIPAATVVVLFGVAGMLAGVRLLRTAADPGMRTIGIGLSGAIAALLVHNLVDATLYNAFASKLYWMLIAAALVAVRRPAAFGALAAPVVRRMPRAVLPTAAAEVAS